MTGLLEMESLLNVCIYLLTGQNVSDLGQIDGVDMWSTLVAGTQSPRTEFVHNIDDMGDKYAAIRWTDWKYIKGIRFVE